MIHRRPPHSPELSSATVSALRRHVARDPSWLLALQLGPRQALALVQGIDPRDLVVLGSLDRDAARRLVKEALDPVQGGSPRGPARRAREPFARIPRVGVSGGRLDAPTTRRAGARPPVSGAREGIVREDVALAPASAPARSLRDLGLDGTGSAVPVAHTMDGSFRHWHGHHIFKGHKVKVPAPPWSQRVVSGGWELNHWSHRDGATLCTLDSGRLLLIGGWDTGYREDPWPKDIYSTPGSEEDEAGRAFTTNEVWSSDNDGLTWQRLLYHVPGLPPNSGPEARFRRVHTPSWAYCGDYFYLIGGDTYVRHSEVWRTSLAGTGEVWERTASTVHPLYWRDRVFSIAGSLNNKLYVMGGQLNYADPTTAQNDVYVSDDGVGWDEVTAPVPWTRRGMVYGMPVIYNKLKGKDELYLLGGGIYDDGTGKKILFDGIYKFDGTAWDKVLGEGHGRWPRWLGGPSSGRAYHNVVRTNDGWLWIITGSVEDSGSCTGILASDDDGVHWSVALDADWGYGGGSHADGVTISKDGKIVRASGNAYDRSTYTISREYVPPRPTVASFSPSTGSVDGGMSVEIRGTGFSAGVKAVIVTTTGGPFDTFQCTDMTTVDDTLLIVVMPRFPLPPADAEIYVVGTGGTAFPPYKFMYTT